MSKNLSELIQDYIKKNSFNSSRGPQLKGGLDALRDYLKQNGYSNVSSQELYECLKQHLKYYSTRG
ncbi:MAG: hypothetical protein KQA41_04525 [Candidatus Aenigmarchaeota archaeon]|nr:hypothetical protein [Candidatus Aenigmarchaeota archaeon]